MKINRIQNSKNNVIFGVLNKITLLFLGFVLRTIMIYTLGAEYLGLNSLFSAILNVLSLAELGFGSALVFSMYKPVAENDEKTICALMYFYRKCYRIIGSVIVVAGICMMPFLQYLIKDAEYPSDINIYVVYMINLASTGVSYFMFAYKNSLLTAHQRNSEAMKVNTVLSIIQYVVQILLLIIAKNYYMYLIIVPIFNILNNVMVAMKVEKFYPQYQPRGKLEEEQLEEIITKVKGLFVYKIGNVVSNSVDSIVISKFLGLTALAIYNNYYYVISFLFGLLAIYYNAMSAGIGNSIVVESVEKNFKDFKKLLFMQGWIMGWSAICLLCLYQDFIHIWVGEKLMFGQKFVVCLVVYYYCWKMQDIVHIYKEAAGMWNQDKFRPLISSCVNLIGNLIMVRYIGIYGVVLSTIISELVINLPWSSKVLMKNYFTSGEREYYFSLVKYTVISILVGIVTYYICQMMPGDLIIRFILKMVICVVVPNILFLMMYFRNKQFKEVIQLVKVMLRN